MAHNGLSILIVTRTHSEWRRNVYTLGEVTPFTTYRTHAESLQRQFDQDGDPARAYVCREAVPTFAALMPPSLEDRPRKGHGVR